MSDFKPEFLAKEADRLHNDQILNLAVAAMIEDAQDALKVAPADNVAEVTKWQQRVQACEGLLDQLQGYILALAEQAAVYDDPAD